MGITAVEPPLLANEQRGRQQTNRYCDLHVQKYIFNPSCVTRASAAVLIRPNCGDPKPVPGIPKFARLNALNNSPRNWSLKRSANTKFFMMPMSKLITPGERPTDRAAFPSRKRSGSVNAAVSNHRSTVRSSDGRSGERRMFARCGPAEKHSHVFCCVVTP